MPPEITELGVSDDGRFVVDALGTHHPVVDSGAKIVSLVPSITELLCDLGLQDDIVARTGFCVHPKATVKRIPKVGGTKDVDVEALKRLAPSHVVVNIDENRKDLFEQLSTFVEHVFVTHPLSPFDNVPLYRALGTLFGQSARADDLIKALEAEFRQLGDRDGFRRREVLYLIWKDPWMAVGEQTYIAEMLKLINWHTCATEAGVRYPEVDLQSFVGRVEAVLLSSEPYTFRDKHVIEVKKIFGDSAMVSLVDGELISWYGSRAIAGVKYLATLARAA